MSKLAKALTAAAGNAGGDPLYVEDVFSTYLYTGTSTSPNTITNGIDLDGEGGLVWLKTRTAGFSHTLFDTERGVNKELYSDSTGAEGSGTSLTAFNSDGFTLGTTSILYNSSSYNYASWTFRKAEKFFDVVTYTGDDVSGREIAHNLGSTPAVIIVKKTSGTYNWQIYHSSIGATKFLEFTTGASQTSSAVWNDTAPTDAVFTVGNEYGVNQSGDTYVAYLFASDAGGFGDDGDESIIKCGSFNTGSGTGSVELGFEPQWVLVKWANGVGDWYLVDVMRGFDNITSYGLSPNTSGAEQNIGGFLKPTATGFTWTAGAGRDYIYIAIRRPMKTPESGTEVFNSLAYTGDGASTRNFDLGLTLDAYFHACRSSYSYDYKNLTPRLTGRLLHTAGTSIEYSSNTSLDVQEGLRAVNFETTLNQLGQTYIINGFKRATGFFDVVAYTGDGVAGRTVAHNLGVVPELMIFKNRTSTTSWPVYYKPLAGAYYPRLDNTDLWFGSSFFNATDPTASVFSLGGSVSENEAPHTYIAYLFASLAGVSKVGSYTGTGSNVNVDCGFSAGARFILIKRTDSTGDWYVWDSERGIVAGNDPYLLLNSTAAEVTSTDYIDPLSSGFTVTSSAPAALNASGGTYIFMAIS